MEQGTGNREHGATLGFSVEAERRLMELIRRNCGRQIEEAVGGDPARAALLAAIAASESGGSRKAFRFEPAIHERLVGLLEGGESSVDGVTRVQLEKKLSGMKSEFERNMLLKRLAGMHGYTLLPGYCSLAWKTTLEALTDKERHFAFAARRLEQICREMELDPETQAGEVAWQWNGRSRSALDGWRLRVRMGLYGEMLAAAGRAA